MLAAKEEATVLIKDISNLKLLTDNPELILKMLTSLEFEILRTLYYEATGLTARAIQKRIVLNKIYIGMYDALIQAKLKKDEGAERLPVPSSFKAWSIPHYEAMTTEELIKYFRKINKKNPSPFNEVPSHMTITKHLENMLNFGLVGKRMFPDKKKPNFVYFISPSLYVLLKQSHDNYNKNPSAFFDLWNKFFVDVPKK